MKSEIAPTPYAVDEQRIPLIRIVSASKRKEWEGFQIAEMNQYLPHAQMLATARMFAFSSEMFKVLEDTASKPMTLNEIVIAARKVVARVKGEKVNG